LWKPQSTKLVGELFYLFRNSSLSLGRSSSPSELALQGPTELKLPTEVMILNQLAKIVNKIFTNFKMLFDKPDFNSEICYDDAREDHDPLFYDSDRIGKKNVLVK